MIEVQQLTVSPFASNCYLLTNAELGETVVVDPGDDPEVIIEALERLGTKVIAIWNTHGHIDHINANQPVKEATGAPITIHKSEEECLQSEWKCGAAMFNIDFRPSKADAFWEDGEKYEALGTTWVCRHAPGHSPGSCLLICETEGIVIGGDLLFQGSIGRMDLPGGSPEQMEESLKSLFGKWGKDEWRVLCGHGPITTLGRERRGNLLVREALEGRLAQMA